MTMFPVNINTSSTGHKLQGRLKDMVIVSSWPKLKNNICFRNWEYVVLSRVRTLIGLFLFQPIDMEQSFKPTEELIQFMKRVERTENVLLQKWNITLRSLRTKKTITHTHTRILTLSLQAITFPVTYRNYDIDRPRLPDTFINRNPAHSPTI
jgi:accessory gene regulator protein AgrB